MARTSYKITRKDFDREIELIVRIRRDKPDESLITLGDLLDIVVNVVAPDLREIKGEFKEFSSVENVHS